jgi:hypothetical protein
MNKHVAPIALSVGLLGLVGGVAAAHAFQPAAKPAPANVQFVQPAAETITPAPDRDHNHDGRTQARSGVPAEGPGTRAGTQARSGPQTGGPGSGKIGGEGTGTRAGTRSAEAGRCE